MAEWHSYISGLRIAGLSDFLAGAAATYQLKLSVRPDRGFLREVLNFTVEGTDENIQAFGAVLRASVAAYNGNPTQVQRPWQSKP